MYLFRDFVSVIDTHCKWTERNSLIIFEWCTTDSVVPGDLKTEFNTCRIVQNKYSKMKSLATLLLAGWAHALCLPI